VPDRTPAKLAEIASVYLGVDYADRVHRVGYLDEARNKFNILPALLYEVDLDSDANILKLNKEETETVAETKAENSKVSYAIVFNQALESQRQVDEIVEAAVGGKWKTDSPIANLGYLFGGVWLLGLAQRLDFRTGDSVVLSIYFLGLGTIGHSA
jgi:hypothetical protein